MRKAADIIMWLGMTLFMPVLGLLLSDIEGFQIYKFYNLIGIVWALLGAFYLSFLINRTRRVRKVMMRMSHYLIIWLLFMLPFGIVSGGLIASQLQMPSWVPVARAGAFLLLPAVVSVFVIEDFSETPKFRLAQKEGFDIAFLGGYFVVAGFMLQLIAATFDLISFNG